MKDFDLSLVDLDFFQLLFWHVDEMKKLDFLNPDIETRNSEKSEYLALFFSISRISKCYGTFFGEKIPITIVVDSIFHTWNVTKKLTFPNPDSETKNREKNV